MRQRCVREDEGSDSGLESEGGYTGVGEEAGELFNAMAWFCGAFNGACEFGEGKKVIFHCSADDFG